MSNQKNLAIYGQKTPPIIDLASIGESVPISMYVGKNDTLATVRDATWLRDTLGPTRVVRYTEMENFSHSNFNWGID